MRAVPVLATLLASSLFTTTALAADDAPQSASSAASSDGGEAELETKPLVYLEAWTSVETVFEQSPPGGPQQAGTLRPGADFGLRAAVGQGGWTKDARVLPGWSASEGNLVEGWTVGVWVRQAAPSPVIEEHLGLSYGLSGTMFTTTGQGLLLANTLDVGYRMSNDSQGRIQQPKTGPLGQVQVGGTQQVMLFDSFLIGPSLLVDIQNERAPWAISMGIRASSIF
jgi:hypothetical protein